MPKASKIKKIKAREILDSRGNPTVEVGLKTNDGVFTDSVPSGASTGKYEAVELRDGGKSYQGLGVLKAVRNIEKIIAPKLLGKDPTKQKEIDELMIELDGTENKSKLGANAILAVSMAVCRAGAAAKRTALWRYVSQISGNKKPSLPKPSLNIINGGVHAGSEMDFQEFMIVPQFKSFSIAIQSASEIYHELKKILKKKYGYSAINVGDEGGFVPPIQDPAEALELIIKAIFKLNYQEKVKIILDVAASQFFINDKYKTKIGTFSRKKLLEYYSELIKNYPIVALEDPFAEEDWRGFQEATKELGKTITIIGDDFLVTNPNRIKEAQIRRACNGAIIKINQIGTISEAIAAAKLAKSFGWKIMVSHRSGDTCDDFIADFSVGISADFIKSGAPARSERLAKYNRLLKIEEEIHPVK